MHIITKIFVVLVSLLAVLLVPLVVVYTHNEDSYKAKWLEAQAQVKVVRAQQEAAESQLGAAQTRAQAQQAELQRINGMLRTQKSGLERDITRLEEQLASAESLQGEVRADLAKIAVSLEAGTELTSSLISDLDALRVASLRTERQNVELDQQLRETVRDLEVAEESRRALQEEISRLTQELSESTEMVRNAIAQGWDVDDDASIGVLGESIDPQIDIEGTIIEVRRSPDRVTAEINLGARDNVKAGWTLNVADGGQFVATLRIIDVQITRSVGVVEMEDRSGRLVQVGQRVFARSRR